MFRNLLSFVLYGSLTFLICLIWSGTIVAQIEPLWDRSYGGSRWEELNSAEETADGGYILAGFSSSLANDGDVTAANEGVGDFWVLKTNSEGDREWDARFGGDELDRCNSVIQTADGGYLLGGTSASDISGQKLSANRGLDDYWIVKIDATGTFQWEATYGGDNLEILSSIVQTLDGGYLLGGLSLSGVSGEKSEPNLGGFDHWIVKISATGVLEWDKTLGGAEEERLNVVQVAPDGHFLLGGSTQSGAGDDITSPSLGVKDMWFVKVSSLNGAIIWQHRYGGSEVEEMIAFQQTIDGGYFLAGGSNSDISGSKSENSRGGLDMWGIKIDAFGTKEWDVTFGGSALDNCYGLKQNSAGYYLLGGFSGSGAEGDKSEPNQGGWDYWMVYIDENGFKQWDRTIGGADNDVMFNLFQNQTGGYILAGASSSPVSGDKTDDTNGLNDFWLVKTVCDLEINLRDTIVCEGEPLVLDAFNNSNCTDCLYDWSDIGRGDSIREISAMTAQNYRVTITNTSGCQKSAEINVAIINRPAAELGADQTTCANDPVLLNPGSSLANDFIWSTSEDTPTISTAEADRYYVTVTASNGCSTVDSVEVFTNPLPIVDLGPDVTICPLEVLMLDAENPGSSYVWSNGESGQMEDFSPTGPESISVAVTDSNNCIGRDTMEVLGVYDLPQVIDSMIICSPDNNTYTIEFTIGGGDPSSYNVTSNVVPFARLGNVYTSTLIPRDDPYSFTITDDRLCAPYVFQGIGDCPCASLAGEPDPTPLEICGDEVITIDFINQFLDATDTVEYFLHDGDASTIGNILLRNNQPEIAYHSMLNYNQIYFLTAIVGNDLGNGQVDVLDGCFSASMGLAVQFFENPVANIISQTGSSTLTCEGGGSSLILSGQNAQPSGNITYRWSRLDGQTVPMNDDINIEVSTAGTYQLIVTNIGSACADTTLFTVNASVDIPVVEIAEVDQLTCLDTVVTLNASNSSLGGPFSAQWTGIGINGNTDLVQTTTAPGTYQLVITNTDNGCTSSASVTVVDNAQPPVVAINGNRFLDCATNTASLEVQILSSTNPFSLLWTNPDGSTISTSDVAIEMNQTGVYTLLVTDLVNGCSTEETVSISPDPGGPTDALFELEDPSCFGEDDGMILIDSVIGGVGPYVYSFGDNNFYSTSNQFVRLTEGTFPISIQDANGCTWNTEVSLTQPNEFIVSLGNDEEILLGDSLRLNGLFSNPVDTFFWSDTSFLSCVACPNPFAKPINTTTILLTAIDENGCESSDIILVSIDKERKIYIPSAFSPNADGRNDHFTIYGGNGVQEIEYLQIFNRWGALIFERKNFSPNADPLGWDGSFRGEPLGSGVYVYQLKVNFIDGFEILYRGDVTIIR